MYQALYRKWRPMTFSDVVGQDHITSVLQFQVREKRTSHAYLFCGSRGTGKTTCAKLLSKAVNCLNPINGDPCNECEACLAINRGTSLDVVELDAASNNRVDDIRRICDEVVYPPAALAKRVYIVDEVHMLTTQAFNALLKTLEEPPAHAVFILATTEMQKVPATIISRCQRFDFSRIRKEKIVDRIMHIASAEGINMERDAAFVLAELSDGAMRDALSLLESCAAKGAFITTEYVINLLGLSNREQLLELLYSCSKQNTTRALAILEELYAKNGDITTAFTELLDICRDVLIVQNVSSPSTWVNTTEDEMKRLREIADTLPQETLNYFVSEIERFISTTPVFGMNKKAAAEIAVIRMTTPTSSVNVDSLRRRIADLERSVKEMRSGSFVPAPSESGADLPIDESAVPDTPKEKAEPKPEKKGNNRNIFEHVNELVRGIGEIQPMTRFFIESAVVRKEGSVLKIICGSLAASTMKMSKTDQLALPIAKKLDPEISSIEIVEGEESSAPSGGENSDLDDLE